MSSNAKIALAKDLLALRSKINAMRESAKKNECITKYVAMLNDLFDLR